MTPKYYDKKCECGRKLDPYAILRVYSHLADPSLQHSVKKLLRLGTGHKDLKTDLREVIESLEEYERYLNESEK